ncbi:MAG TPA: DNA cytosine methyltransferase [Streptomyces sp.]|nr:DNA cytosine methyltransferase [Streptomyces sp.]
MSTATLPRPRSASAPARPTSLPRRARKVRRAYRHDGDALTVMDWFCGAGGSSQGAHAVPNVHVERAANHWEKAIASHAANFPDTDHYQGDIRKAPVWDWPITDIFWASPECTRWSIAQGKQRDFDKAMQGTLFDLLADQEDEEETSKDKESRALMEEVPLYLRGVIERGGLVKAGVVENVIDVRAWHEWGRWLGEIRKLGYKVRVIALNSMHAEPRRTLRAPQSRDRLYVAYWHESLGRDPDWDKWLRPRAWCPVCQEWVRAVQVFKNPQRDMGRYRQQYVYRCPRVTCRNQMVEPEALPALVAIDWSIPGQRIGDRDTPLAEKTMRRIREGLERFARPVPMVVPAGGTWRDAASSVLDPMPTRTTRENDALVVPPLLVPAEGRDGKRAAPATEPLRTQTARAETALAWLPFIAEIRGGGSTARPVTEALATVCASGNHHGLVAPEGAAEHMLVPYYSSGAARPVTEPVGALSTRDRYALVHGTPRIEDVLFRMLQPHEIGRAMAFADDYTVVGSKRDKVQQYGNAVTPPAAEVLVCALVEAITGEELSRYERPEAGELAGARG